MIRINLKKWATAPQAFEATVSAETDMILGSQRIIEMPYPSYPRRRVSKFSYEEWIPDYDLGNDYE